MSRALLAAIASLLMSQMASAAPTLIYVGSWQVDEGPSFNSPPNGPTAYTGQEAAALLFGGNASDYAISTLGTNSANVDHMAWYSLLGSTVGSLKAAENYSSKYLGQYYGPVPVTQQTTGTTGPASAYVNDNAVGANFTNYAFKVQNGAPTIGTPEPASMTMFGVMLVSGAIGFRRRNAAAKA